MVEAGWGLLAFIAGQFRQDRLLPVGLMWSRVRRMGGIRGRGQRYSLSPFRQEQGRISDRENCAWQLAWIV
ncbi:protein of unknown function [Pseudorhizobium banfieldiae]|uniref:Uncharacterized protein n=1 Tax=Pseudorhizobium banfieldiae TaxID=1125847 RepID=L0NJJ8_9HYPH|nr:protein of unknown function [Pseudorhizobium banfieldiae]